MSVHPVESAPIARVIVDSPLPHLDREFDYLVPEGAEVVPGCRVKVRFAGKLLDAFVVEVVDRSDHDGKLSPLAKVVSVEPVLTPEVLALCRQVARRWAGTTADVIRLAVPPRQARVEAHPAAARVAPPAEADDDAWIGYDKGARFVAALRAGDSPRVVLGALPHHRHARTVAQAVAATLASGRGALVCVPDIRDLHEFDTAFSDVLGDGRHVVLTAAQKPAERYRAFLKLARGEVRAVVGTRAAAYAPVADLGLVAIWDDGDDLFAEPRAPYPHAREVLLLRAASTGCGVLIAGFARSVEAQSLVENGWCAEVGADPVARRREWPTLDVVDGTEHGGAPVRLPSQVFVAIRATSGSVLIQVPRRGYRSSLACQRCRTPATCTACHGPLTQSSAIAPLRCRWCGTRFVDWHCNECGSGQLRAPVVGALRTAEEFAAAFPDRVVMTSGGRQVLDRVEGSNLLVLATPGAEPKLDGGYALVILMDTNLMLMRDDVRVVEESHRRWFNALALTGFGAKAVAVGESTTLQALVRADPASVARRELGQRAETHLPPIGRLAVVEGDLAALDDLARSAWTPHTEILGPVEFDDHPAQLVLRSPRSEGLALADRLKAFSAERSQAKKSVLRVHIDPSSF